MQDVKRVLADRGHNLDTATAQRAAIQDLLANVARVGEEAGSSPRSSSTAPREGRYGGVCRAFTCVQQSGTAGDSSVLTQFAVDRALCGSRAWRAGRAIGDSDRDCRAWTGLRRRAGRLRLLRPGSLPPFTLPTAPAVRARAADRRRDHHARHQPAGQRAPARRRSPRDDRCAAYRLVLPWNPAARAAR